MLIGPRMERTAFDIGFFVLGLLVGALVSAYLGGC